MAAGAAMAVVGWWSGYKLGGVIALFTAQYFEEYWYSKLLAINFFNSRNCSNFNEHRFNVCS